jgi:hypothetical protein
MKRMITVVVFAGLLVAATAAAEVQVRLTGSVALHFDEASSAGEPSNAFSLSDGEFFGGPGWEILVNHTGIGGNYLVSFFEDGAGVRYVDWVSEALFLSFHLFDPDFPLDPFVHLGLGAAGRSVADDRDQQNDPATVSLFPMLVAGLGLDLGGLLVGTRLTWAPTAGPPTATDIVGYPVREYQVAFYGGVALEGHRGRHR